MAAGLSLLRINIHFGPGLYRAALRGGNWNNASNARAGFALNLNNPPSNTNNNIGFRAALPESREKLAAYRAVIPGTGKGVQAPVAP